MERQLAPPRVERRAPKARDRIEVDVPGKGPHPAVVLHVESGMIVVAVCSTTPIAETEIPGTVVDRDPGLSQMRLRPGDTTRFYECHIQPMEWSGADFDVRGKCLGGRFDRLFGAMEKIARESLAGTRTITPIPRHAQPLVKQLERLVSNHVPALPVNASERAVDPSSETETSSDPSRDG